MLRDRATEIGALVRRYCSEDLTSLEVDKLAKFAATVVKQRLYGRLRSVARFEGTTIEQQALSVVSRLFKESGGRPALCDALGEFLAADDVTLFIRFQSIAIVSAEQELFQRWGDTDPLSARLWRTLRSALRKDGELVLFPAENPQWVALAAASDLRELCPSATFDEVSRLIVGEYKPGSKLSELAKSVLSQIADADNCQNAVRLDYLFAGLRDVVSETAAQDFASESLQMSSDPSLAIVVERAKHAASQVAAQLLDRYLQAEKLAPDEVERIRRTLEEVVTDLADGGPAQSYYSYLSTHWDGLTEQCYRQQYRTRFEYLASLAQTTFYDAMRKELSA